MDNNWIDLSTPVACVTSMMDSLSNQMDKILEIFEYGEILETVITSLPPQEIIDNIIEVYYYLGLEVFWPHPNETETAVKSRIAFPILIDRIQERPLPIETLHNLALIFKFGLCRLPNGQLEETWGAEQDKKIEAQIKDIFAFAPNARAVRTALMDTTAGYPREDATKIAVIMSGANEFDLRFSAIKALPEYFLQKYEYDLRRNEAQASIIYDWALRYFAERGVDLNRAPEQNLDDAQYKVLADLNRIFAEYPGMGSEIVRYAVACDNAHARYYAVCVLNKWPVAYWPNDAHKLLSDAGERMTRSMHKNYFFAAMKKWDAQNSV